MTQTRAEPNTLPPAYAKLGATTGFCPPSPEDCRIVVASPGGDGKSTFAMSIPDAIVLDFDRGTHSIAQARATRMVIGEGPSGRVDPYDHYQRIMTRLCEDGEKGKSPFRRVVIDTADTWTDLLGQHLAEEKKVESVGEYGQKGAGWSLLRERCKLDIQGLQAAGYSWMVLCHITEKNVTLGKEEHTVMRPSVFPSCYDMIRNLADIEAVIRCERRTVEKTEQRTFNIGGKSVTRDVPTGESETLHKYIMQLESDDLRRAKRRLVGLGGELVVPAIDAWSSTFRPFYVKAVSDIVKQYGEKPPTW